MRDVWSLLRTVRFSVLSLAVYLLLLWSPQGVDSMLTLLDRPGWQWILINYLAIQIWQWSRLMVTYRYLPLDRRDIDGDALARMLDKSGQDLESYEKKYDSEAAASVAGVNLERLRAAHQNLRVKVAKIVEQNERRNDPERVARLQGWMMWLPRLLGAAVYVLAARSLYVAATSYGGLERVEKMRLCLLSALMLANGGLFVVFAWRRRELINGFVRAWLRPDWLVEEMRDRKVLPARSDGSEVRRPTKDEVSRLSPGGRVAWRLVQRKERFVHAQDELRPGTARRLFASIVHIDSSRDVRESWRWHEFSDLHRNTRNWLRGLAMLASAAFAFTIIFPDWSEQFGPVGNVAIPLAFWTMLGSVLVWWFDHRRVPLIIPLFMWGLLTNQCWDNHAVRTLDTASAAVVPPSETLPATRPTVDVYVASQLAARPGLSTPVIVATAGGGIRAAYWTATVLAELDAKAKDGGFRRNLLAVSAVSGGGLGAAAYLAAAHSATAPLDPKQLDAFLAHDFLAPTVGALVGRDLIYRLLPIYQFEDRAAALERSWERAWTEEFGGAGQFSTGYSSFHQSTHGTLPALLVNGASVATGERIITSPFVVGWAEFREAHDFFDYNGQRDIPLSTSVTNGARFPLVSPAGTLRDRQGTALGQIVDGGYFENFGAETALDFLQVLCEARAAKPQTCGDDAAAMRPIVIQISSDPALATPDPNSEARAAPLVTQAFAPVATFLNTRDARGESAMRELESEVVQRYSGVFVHVRLFRSPDREDPPLGWVLSSAAREAIRSNVGNEDNQRAFASVHAALTR